MRSCQSVPIMVGNDSMGKSSFEQGTQHLCTCHVGEKLTKLDTICPFVAHISLYLDISAYVFMMAHGTRACFQHAPGIMA